MSGGTLTGVMSLGYDGNGFGMNLFTASGSGLTQINYPNVNNAYFAFGSDLTYSSGSHTWRPAGFSTDGNPDPNDGGGGQSLSMQAQSDINISAGYGGKDAGNASADITFKTASGSVQYTSTERMRIRGNGNVGIGTSAADFKLDVRDSSYNVLLVSGAGNGNYPILHVKDSADISTALFEGNRAGDQSSRIALWHNPASSHGGSHTAIMFQMNDNGNNKTNYAQIRSGIDVITDGSEGGNLQFHVMKAGTLTEAARFQDEGRLGIGTTAPNVELHVNGDGRFEENHKLHFSDSATNTFIRGASSDLELHSGDDLYFNAADDIRIDSAQVEFRDTSSNTHLMIAESGTNAAQFSAGTTPVFVLKDDVGVIMDDNQGIKNHIQPLSNFMIDAGTGINTVDLQGYSKIQNILLDPMFNPAGFPSATSLNVKLPVAVAGMEFIVTLGTHSMNLGNLTLKLIANGSDIIHNGANAVSNVTYAKNTGESIHVICFEANKWSVVAHV